MAALDLGDLSGLDLRQALEPSAQRATAALRLAAVMAWPDDADARAGHWTTVGSEALPPLGATGPEADAKGITAVLDLMAGHSSHWYIAGSVIYLVRTMALYHANLPGGPSVAKALSLLERFSEGPAKPPDLKELRRIWARYRPVAHLCAGFVSLLNEVRRRPDDEQDALAGAMFFDMLGVMLALGRTFQDFATGYKAPGHKSPLLEAANIWTVPAALDLPPAEVRTAPFSAGTLAALKAYRAASTTASG